MLVWKDYHNPIPDGIVAHWDLNNFALRTVPNIASKQIISVNSTLGANEVRVNYSAPVSPIFAVSDKISTSGFTGADIQFNFNGIVKTIMNPTAVIASYSKVSSVLVFGSVLTRVSRADEDGAVIIHGDLSGTGNNLIQPKANGATSTTGRQGGRQVLDLESIKSWLLTEAFDIPQPYTIAIVCSQSISQVLYGGNDDTLNAQSQRLNFAGLNIIQAPTTLVDGASNTNFHVDISRFDGDNSRMVNDTGGNTGPAGANKLSKGLIINGGFYGQLGGLMEVAEIIIFNRGLTDDEIDILDGYLRGKWVV